MHEKLKAALDGAFKEISNEFKAQGIKVLMPTYSPQQGRLLSEFNRAGGSAVISGGLKGMPAFKNVPQYGLPFDTSAYLNTFPEGMCAEIVSYLPDSLLQDQKVALFTFIPPVEQWATHIRNRGLNTDIVAVNEQNTRQFFERKGNLVHILQQAGLGAYVIPTEVVAPGSSEAALRAVYQRIRNDGNGKVVVQPCIENYEPTIFIDNEDAFVAKMKNADGLRKVVRFVEGSEANLSFFVGNIQPAQGQRGVAKCNLPEGIDLDDPTSLAQIEKNAQEHGIDAASVFSLTGRATLKVVGEILLANEHGDSVGNNIGHVYDDSIAAQITEVGDRLGNLMGRCGKVGLAGADLIIDRQGKIWINEINDRQQGPTDQMSADAESAGLPGLSRLAWFAHFADFSRDKNLNLMAAIRDHADMIHQKYMKSPGSFYLKAFANHDAQYDGRMRARKNLPSGLYVVTQGADGGWQWAPANDVETERPVNLASGAVTLRISGGGLRKGDAALSGSEMFRITGVASGEDSPIVIQDGISRLNPQWVPIIERLYTDCFGADYLSKNPLLKPDAGTAKAKSTLPAQVQADALQKTARRSAAKARAKA